MIAPARAKGTWLGLIALFALGGSGLACGGSDTTTKQGAEPVACTLIGCEPAVGLYVEAGHLPPGLGIRMCFRGRCVSRPIGHFRGRTIYLRSLRSDRSSGRRERLIVSVVDADGGVVARHKTLLNMYALRPNGPNCPPPCHVTAVFFDPGSGKLEQARKGWWGFPRPGPA